MSKTLNDCAWEKIFDKYRIVDHIEKHEKFVLSASQIKEFREPRLMAKFDHSINLPHIFKKEALSILPISRGMYVISYFENYKKFENINTQITTKSLPTNLQSLDKNNITSETIAINCAYASGIIQDFLGEENLVSTVSGRMGSGQFNFEIRNNKNSKLLPIAVDSSQIEIDAAFESQNSLTLIEAKRDIAEDFLIRQLFYPYNLWNRKIHKKVRPVFFVYSNGIFNLYEYDFKDPSLYNSLEIVQQKNYRLEDLKITKEEIMRLARNTKLIQEPKTPFPQADNFKRVINICELLTANPMTKNDITEEYAFDIRQTDYYTNACKYLGLLDLNKKGKDVIYQLSAKGQEIISLPQKKRILSFCNCIFEHKVFRDVYIASEKTLRILETNKIVQIMKQNPLYNVKSDTTFERRASTIKGWINWVLEISNV